MDSATTAAIAQRDGFDVHALSVRYGQRHAIELEAARRLARRLGLRRHVVIELDLRAFGGSALTADIAVPKDTPMGEIGAGIPATYVPARNTIFLSLALAWAETLGARDIFIGANALDYSGYPDCRPEYLEAYRPDGGPRHPGRRRGRAAHDPRPAAPPHQGRDRGAGSRAGPRLRPHEHVLRSRRRRRRPAAGARPVCCGSRGSRRPALPTRRGTRPPTHDATR